MKINIKLLQKYLYNIYIILLFLFYNININSNIIYAADSNIFIKNSNIEIGFSNLNDIWNFIGNVEFNLNTDFGIFGVKNIYTGISAEQINNNFRDAEEFIFSYKYNIFNNIYVVSEFNVNLLSDINSTNINELFRLSNLYGFSFNYNSIGILDILAGIENNKQLNAQSTGFIFKGRGKLKEFNLDNYKFNINVLSDILLLKDNRNSEDITINANMLNSSDIDLLTANIHYKLKGRNFLHSIDSMFYKYVLESYKENRIGGNLESKIHFKKLLFNVNASIENIYISRFFEQNIETNKSSLIIRNYNELKLYLKTNLKYIINNFEQNLSMQIDYRGEDNFIKEKDKISNIDFLSLQNVEIQKDNLSTTINLFYNNLWQVTNKDTFLFNISVSKLEYNTPSEINNDDRDELYILGNINYKKRFSDFLLFNVNLNLTENHLVFIKKENSMQNNWNKIINLTSDIIFSNGTFLYHPFFGVLANYMIYDFEYLNNLNSIKSYSFRQISYKDSLQLNLTSMFVIANKLSLRYYEQGILNWNNFSEKPQRSNFEFVVSPAIKILFDNKIFSFGFKIFYLKYGLFNTSNNILMNVQKLSTYSPYYSCSLNMKKINLNFYGWLEYKYINRIYSGINPNLFLKISYLLK